MKQTQTPEENTILEMTPHKQPKRGKRRSGNHPKKSRAFPDIFVADIHRALTVLPAQKTKSLRSLVRKAMGMSAGAPEVVFGVCVTTSMDPWIHWMMTAIRFWHFAVSQGELEMLRALPLRRTTSILSVLKFELRKLDLELVDREIVGHDLHVTLAWEWKICRPMVMRLLKNTLWTLLQKRRPMPYDGLTNGWVCEKAHAKMLTQMDPYRGKILARVWAGVAMTRAHKHSMNPEESPLCECGHEQTMRHLLYDCPATPLIPEHLRYWKHLPSARSVALLCSREYDQSHWRDMCYRAVRVLSLHSEVQPERQVPGASFDAKGHLVQVDRTGTYSYWLAMLHSKAHQRH